MNSSPARVAAVTAGLLAAGALFGAIAGALALVLVSGLFGGGMPPFSAVAFAAAAGAVAGASLLPLTSWVLLRRVPLGLSWLGTTVGTVIGAALGWFVAGAFPIMAAILGAVLGFSAAALVLRARFSAPRDAAPVRRAPA